jgi:uncharacterized membrane protein YhiD involved in acid resistance
MFDIRLSDYDPETPSFYVMLITALVAFLLSGVIAITYEYTTKSLYKRAHFVQSLALIGVVAATIMQAIGDSVAIGLGMIGALAIIRFRTALNDPRNITFMFASLGAGIATGVLGYAIAITGTLVFCAAAIILRFSPLKNPTELIGELRLQVPKDDIQQEKIEEKLNKYCAGYQLEGLRYLNPKKMQSFTEEGVPMVEEISRENLQEFTYLIRMKRKATVTALSDSLYEMEGLENLRLRFEQQSPKL